MSDNAGYTFLVSQEPNTDPILMLYDEDKMMLKQIDVLTMASQVEEAEGKTENSGNDSEIIFEMSDENDKDNALNAVTLPEEYTQKLL